jgi:hypothetical protein
LITTKPAPSTRRRQTSHRHTRVRSAIDFFLGSLPATAGVVPAGAATAAAAAAAAAGAAGGVVPGFSVTRFRLPPTAARPLRKPRNGNLVHPRLDRGAGSLRARPGRTAGHHRGRGHPAGLDPGRGIHYVASGKTLADRDGLAAALDAAESAGRRHRGHVRAATMAGFDETGSSGRGTLLTAHSSIRPQTPCVVCACGIRPLSGRRSLRRRR